MAGWGDDDAVAVGGNGLLKSRYIISAPRPGVKGAPESEKKRRPGRMIARSSHHRVTVSGDGFLQCGLVIAMFDPGLERGAEVGQKCRDRITGWHPGDCVAVSGDGLPQVGWIVTVLASR